MLVQTKTYAGDLESHQFLGGASLNLVRGFYGQNESALLIGTYGGQVQKVSLKHPTTDSVALQDAFRGGMIQWSAQAQFVLQNIDADVKTIGSLKSQVDSYMNDRKNRLISQWKKSGMQTDLQVYPEHIFNSKLPIVKLFPPFARVGTTTFQKHNGPVTSIQANPFKDYSQLFLSASSDGQIRINDSREKNKVVLTFEP